MVTRHFKVTSIFARRGAYLSLFKFTWAAEADRVQTANRMVEFREKLLIIIYV